MFVYRQITSRDSLGRAKESVGSGWHGGKYVLSAILIFFTMIIYYG